MTKVVERARGRVMTLSDKATLAEIGEGGFNCMPVGAGPFRITNHIFGERLEFEAAGTLTMITACRASTG